MSHTSTWNVTGMTCGHCAASVTEEIAEIPGVESVEVSHEAGTAVVTSTEPVERAAVEAAVVEAGYELA
ncbi:heavy-metal-associated domain-containing protein [Nocardioides sp. cx-173]|uniref:heavy-metal-associated domain-containing protein n=1 Tax=Nocardioides sp. cx-173 TaxID=2898796 RepID=UPI001E495C41|nr:heavy-metal-associated domain-containing protein [Nocardioides sp. cx-173]MCD4526898.1 heavy-metal-associated domain-containing protein [Nocardioides sp. cx-173]UGB41313.1 heavy-metal-associated domain-containing protein [Nocardioides sp. cx-173]